MNKHNWLIVFHGTWESENAISICNQSWNIAKRYLEPKKGEFFTSSLKTALKYAGPYGRVMVTLICNPDSLGSHIIGNTIEKHPMYNDTETWYIINNTSDKTFVLPIGFINYFSM